MSKPIHEVALFRLSVIGPLVSRARLEKGELKALIKMIASQHYQTPDGKTRLLSDKTIERWYYLWLKQGVDGLSPKRRTDKGTTQLPDAIVQTLLDFKRERPSRSINTLIKLLEEQGLITRGELSRSSVHRVLQRHGLSSRVVSDGQKIERRSFEAENAGDIWYGDVMHGPSIMTESGKRKIYLVSLMDDASRLLCHSAFYLSETALSIENALKEALLKRGLPKKLIVDNGAAYRCATLQTICARLDIRLVYCRPYEPQGKGKLERWHRTLREQFLAEVNLQNIRSLSDINSRLWVWLEQFYHQQPHSALSDNQSPLSRWQSDLLNIRQLGHLAEHLDTYFNHRIKRSVRKDGTLSFEGQRYEVPYALCGECVYLVIDPHTQQALHIESLDYEPLGPVHPLDKQANSHRRRQRPDSAKAAPNAHEKGLVDVLHDNYQDRYDITQLTIREED